MAGGGGVGGGVEYNARFGNDVERRRYFHHLISSKNAGQARPTMLTIVSNIINWKSFQPRNKLSSFFLEKISSYFLV